MHWHKARGKWAAVVGHNGRSHWVGLFDDVKEAEVAVTALRSQLFTNNLLDRKAS